MHPACRVVGSAFTCICLLAVGAVRAAEVAPAPPVLKSSGPDAAQAAAAFPAEPNVQHIVVEDDGARIEELRVRGLTTQITVHPKGGAKAYEILPTDPSRETPNSAGSARNGGGGLRVWHLLSF